MESEIADYGMASNAMSWLAMSLNLTLVATILMGWLIPIAPYSNSHLQGSTFREINSLVHKSRLIACLALSLFSPQKSFFPSKCTFFLGRKITFLAKLFEKKKKYFWEKAESVLEKQTKVNSQAIAEIILTFLLTKSTLGKIWYISK